MSCRLYIDIRNDQLPIVYDDKYNVSFGGFEKFHVFDVKKWRNVVNYLKAENFLTDEELVKPLEAKKTELLLVHTAKYLKSLKWSAVVAVVTEVPFVALVPNFFVQKAILKPLRIQTGGSVLAGKLALERGWAINIGGGFHHCYSSKGGGFCPYADITLLIKCLMNANRIKKAMIVDLDAHQGNGHERDFLNTPEVYIMDMYNRNIYPRDRAAKRAIRKKVELRNRVDDLEYLLKLRYSLREALEEFSPDIIVYNAGTDILYPDPLGMLYISEHGIIKRDEIVFTHCKERKIPIVMLTSGGYLRKTARIIANSIMNLERKGLITVNNRMKNKPPLNLIQAKSSSEPTVSVNQNKIGTTTVIIENRSGTPATKIQEKVKPGQIQSRGIESISDLNENTDTKKRITLAEFLNESKMILSEKEIEPPVAFRNCGNINKEPIPPFVLNQTACTGNSDAEMLPVN